MVCGIGWLLILNGITSRASALAGSSRIIQLQVVPVLPFSLVERSGVAPDDGNNHVIFPTQILTKPVQFWASMLLMTFGISMALGARKYSNHLSTLDTSQTHI